MSVLGETKTRRNFRRDRMMLWRGGSLPAYMHTKKTIKKAQFNLTSTRRKGVVRTLRGRESWEKDVIAPRGGKKKGT